ncbi:MAG: EboA domain-containing protein [Bacteroidota bacterium]
MNRTASTEAIQSLLSTWLEARLRPDQFQAVQAVCAAVAGGAPRAKLYVAFNRLPKQVGKADLELADAALTYAEQARAGWDPRAWSVDQIARTLLILSVPADDTEGYVDTLRLLYETADVAAAVALYQMLPLLAHPEAFLFQATEGLRSNMTTVFDAVALRNPYPAEQFGENAFNQMVLKALFIGSPLHRIVGLDACANATLAQMLTDYAHERWAASRTVTHELWRPVGPFAEGAALADLERVLTHADPIQQQAGALALAASPDPDATHILARRADLHQQIAQGALTWETLART